MATTSQTPEPKIVARYLTVGGADVEIRDTSSSTIRFEADCSGCRAEESWGSDLNPHYPGTTDRFLAAGRTWAQEHAEKCRAMPTA